MLRWILAFVVFAGMASAQDLPRLHDVVGVASNDVLNVRAGPGVKNPIVGELAYDAQNVEVLRVDGNWGLVNVDEGSGWTSMRFLRAQNGGTIQDVSRFICYGTEPFWDFEVEPGRSAVFKSPMELDGLSFSSGPLERASGFNRKFVLFAQTRGNSATLVVNHLNCSDGMSDREFGIDATLILQSRGGEQTAFSGCCSLVLSF